jgi:hypothetical protein
MAATAEFDLARWLEIARAKEADTVVVRPRLRLVQPDERPVIAEVVTPLRRGWIEKILIAMLLVSVLIGACGATAGYVWHATDAKAQNRYVAMVENFKAAGWAPTPYGDPTGYFDREKGKRKELTR